MARRVAINLGQRTAFADRGRGSGGRGRGGKPTVSRAEPKIVANAEKPDEVVVEKTAQEDTTKVRTETVEKKEVPVEISVLLPVKQGTKRSRDELELEEKESVENVNEEKENKDTPELLKTMGFERFNTTKYKHVKGTDCFGISFKQKTEYRQYMNREGGFNRALSPTRGDRKRIKISLKKE